MWRWDQQEPFGVNPADENPSGLGAFDLPLRLPGQYFDKETNLHYNYFRDYDPSLGRYVQSDPLGIEGGINTYRYSEADPLALSDPTGEFPIQIIGAIGAASFNFGLQVYLNYQANNGNWLARSSMRRCWECIGIGSCWSFLARRDGCDQQGMEFCLTWGLL